MNAIRELNVFAFELVKLVHDSDRVKVLGLLRKAGLAYERVRCYCMLLWSYHTAAKL